MLPDLRIPIIKPVPEGIARPLWSVMIPVYNCIDYLPQTLLSILSQDPGESVMEIFVVDDCSTDGNIKELVNNIGKTRVRYIRQEVNVGSLKNFETCLNIATGHFIHLIHGDDFVLDGYYKKMTQLFQDYPEAGAAFCNFQYVNQSGSLIGYELREQKNEGLIPGWLIKVARKQRLQYCAVSVRRKVYEELGGFYGVHYGEDWEMWARIAARYNFAYAPQTLASYRRHLNSISGRYLQNGQNLRDIRWVIDQIQQYIPPDERKAVKKAALRFYARYTLTQAFSIWFRTKDKAASIHMAKQAFTLYNEPYLMLRKIWLRIKMLISAFSLKQH